MDPFAKHVGNVIKYNCFSNTDSFVFALYAKWGKGKTSFINLLKPYLIKLGNNNQNKKSKNICIFDLLLNGIVKLHIILFVWLFSFEEFLLKYDLFKNILISTCNIDYNVYLLAIVYLVLKIILSFKKKKKIPNIKLDYINNNINILMDMIEKYKTTTQSTTETTTNYITIDLIDDKHLKPKPKSIRINEFIYQEWQEFCNKQHYSKMDLISMALKEYMEKYK